MKIIPTWPRASLPRLHLNGSSVVKRVRIKYSLLIKQTPTPKQKLAYKKTFIQETNFFFHFLR